MKKILYFTYFVLNLNKGDNMESMFSKNIKYLINSGKIDVKTILKITNHSSKSLVSMWRSGERYIITEDAVKLSNYLGITVDDLLNKDLRNVLTENNEVELLFSKYKDILTDDDKETIKFIIEKRKKDIDKQ